MRHGFMNAALLRQKSPQLIVRFGIPGVELQRRLIMLTGGREIAAAGKNLRQIVVGVRARRIDLKRILKLFDRFGNHIALDQRAAQIV